MSLPLEFVPGSHSWVYEAVGWPERLERIPNDFGQPNRTNPASWSQIEDWENSPEHLLATIF